VPGFTRRQYLNEAAEAALKEWIVEASTSSQVFVRWFALAALIALIDGVALFLTGVVLEVLGLGQEPPCEGWFCGIPTGPAAVMRWTGGFLAIVGGFFFMIIGVVIFPLVGLGQDWPRMRLLPVEKAIVAVLAILTFAVIAVAEWRASVEAVEAIEKRNEEQKEKQEAAWRAAKEKQEAQEAAQRTPKVVEGSNLSDSDLRGGAGDDTLRGYEGDDVILSLEGNDTIYGGPGNDKIRAFIGKDVIYGESGDDIIVEDGEEWEDYIDCGEGEDSVEGAWELDKLVNCESISEKAPSSMSGDKFVRPGESGD
jgi:RTX calcium-binding nonapeptide repeat (4 copies)